MSRKIFHILFLKTVVSKWIRWRFNLLTFLFGSLILSCEINETIDPELGRSFVKFYGGIKQQQGFDIKQTADGGYILFGSTTSFGNGGSDMYLVKVDRLGNEVWSNTYGGGFNDVGRSIQIVPGGGYALLGDYERVQDSTDMYFVRVDVNGAVLFERRFNNSSTNSNEQGFEIQNTLDGGFILVGSTTKTDGIKNAPVDFYLVKTDNAGILEWERTRGFEGTTEIGRSIVQIDENSYIISGTTESRRDLSQEGTNIFVYKINANGDELGTNFFGGLGNEEGHSITKMGATFLIVGTTGSGIGNGGGGQDALLINMDANLNEIFSESYGGPEDEWGLSVQQLSDGGFIIAGSTTSFREGASDKDYYMVRTDPGGRELDEWRLTPRIFGGKGNDEASAVVQTADGGFALFGTSTFFESTNNTVLCLIKTNPKGELLP
ncbi:hypothetical protein QQ008_28355 [Fulvivirgaceae bacterium BMA10]|uniref:Lipoprotein n=1 Tax=Splendidivirga corallicola TaxID=3051826 RepID=A0ABT8KX37_9BACT|nr:hypothetical protein [Fulvivirgaceae bacterium BMA10]